MNTSSPQDFEAILSRFDIQGNVREIKPYGSGHINGTFLVKNSVEGAPDYLLQRVNDYVFKDVPGLMQNAVIVTEHLRKKLEQIPGSNPEREVLTIIPTKNGEYYYKDEEGNYWRVYLYVGNTKSYDILETEQQASEGGKAFGRFQFLLSDLDSSRLIETIPNFLNMESRLKNFHKAVKEDAAGRVKECQAEITFINERADAMCTIVRLGREGKLPLRITHNDTKFNNVLLDENDKALCVIDLDTVMPGYTAYDFGDAMRTITNTAAEDEKDLSKIQVNLPLFEAYTKSYLKEAAGFLTEAEINSLMEGVLLLPFMQAVRFLTDYLEGDKYYKIHFPGHNLQRTRAQLQLFKKLEENYSRMNDIIQNEVSALRASLST